MFAKLSTVIIVVLLCTTITAQDKVKWLTWDQAVEKSAKEKKKIFVSIYTDWCTYCKQMDKETFENPAIAKHMNENFYAVKFNAEQKKTIYFRDQEFEFIKQGKRGYHQLAAVLTQYKLYFPTIVFLDEDIRIIQPIPGFRPRKEFDAIMRYISEDYYRNTPWKSYVRKMSPKDDNQSNKYSRTVINN